MSRNVVAQDWPIAGGGHLTLVLSTPEPDAQLWWHVYGGQMPLGSAIAEDGSPSKAFKLSIYGESNMHPDDVPKEPRGDVLYLGSFDHDPTSAEVDALKPEEYREVEQ